MTPLRLFASVTVGALVALSLPRGLAAQPVRTLGSVQLPGDLACGFALISYGNFVIVPAGTTVGRYNQNLQLVGDPITIPGISGISNAVRVGDMGYFLASDAPGQIIKINLETWTTVGTLALSVNYPNSAGRLGNYLYITSGPQPPAITRVNLLTFTEVNESPLVINEANSLTRAVATSNGYVFFASNEQPTKLIRVDPAWSYTTLEVPTVDYSNGMTAYQGQIYLTSFFSDQLARVDAVSMALNGSVGTGVSEFAVNAFDGYAYINDRDNSRLATVDLNTFTTLGVAELFESGFASGQIAFTGGEFGYMVACADPSLLVKFGPLLRSTPPCTAAGVSLTGKASRRSVTLKRPAGPTKKAARPLTVRYTAKLANDNKNGHRGAAFAQAGMVISLPADVVYVRSSVSPAAATPGQGKTRDSGAGVYDPVERTVTWPDVPLEPGKRRRYTVWTTVKPTAAAPASSLVYKAACPNCPQLLTQSKVLVKAL